MSIIINKYNYEQYIELPEIKALLQAKVAYIVDVYPEHAREYDYYVVYLLRDDGLLTPLWTPDGVTEKYLFESQKRVRETQRHGPICFVRRGYQVNKRDELRQYLKSINENLTVYDIKTLGYMPSGR